MKNVLEKFDSSPSLVGAQSTMHGGEGVEVRDQQEQLSSSRRAGPADRSQRHRTKKSNPPRTGAWASSWGLGARGRPSIGPPEIAPSSCYEIRLPTFSTIFCSFCLTLWEVARGEVAQMGKISLRKLVPLLELQEVLFYFCYFLVGLTWAGTGRPSTFDNDLQLAGCRPIK